MVVVREQDGVDRPEVGGGDRRSGELARPRAPAEEVPLPGGSNVGSVSSRQPATSIRTVGPADVRQPHVSAVVGSARLAWPVVQSRM